MKVIDIHYTSVWPETLWYLEAHHIQYFDENEGMREHLINILEIDGLYDDWSDASVAEVMLSEIEELKSLAGEHDAAYIRFVRS